MSIACISFIFSCTSLVAISNSFGSFSYFVYKNPTSSMTVFAKSGDRSESFKFERIVSGLKDERLSIISFFSSCIIGRDKSELKSKPSPSFFSFCFFSFCGIKPLDFRSVPKAMFLTSIFSLTNFFLSNCRRSKSMSMRSISKRFFIGAFLSAC